jgi:multidrug efflux system membrane fusion protein
MSEQVPLALEPKSIPSPRIPHKKHRTRSRRWIWLLLIALLGVAAYRFGPQIYRKVRPSGGPPEGASKKGRGPLTIPVVTAVCHRGEIGVYVTGLGVATPIYTVTVKSRVDGQLMDVLYREGETVKQGDVLVEIDPRPYQVQLMQAEGQLAKDQATLDNARVDLARYQTLWAQNAIPQQQLATQQSLVTQYEGNIKTDQGQIEAAKLNLTYCHITAPITGRVGLRLVDPGNIVHASDNGGLLVITQLQPISVIFTIAEDQLPPVLKRVEGGQKLAVEAWDRDSSKRLAQGTLITIDNQIDQTTGTVKLRANFENKNNELFPNQFVNTRLLVEEKRNVALVPNAAIQWNSQAAYVYVVKPDQTVAVRSVTTGTTEGGQTEIVSGLASGETVVTDGVDKLQEGSKVTTRGNSAQPTKKRR